VRQPKRWWPWFFDNLRQRSHSLRGSRGRRESWPISFSLRRPPIKTDMGVREIAQRQTSLRRPGSNKSAAWNAWRLLAAILTKAKNTKCRNTNCFLISRFSGNYQDTPRICTVYVYTYVCIYVRIRISILTGINMYMYLFFYQWTDWMWIDGSMAICLTRILWLIIIFFTKRYLK
jgi:hypothetical protein